MDKFTIVLVFLARCLMKTEAKCGEMKISPWYKETKYKKVMLLLPLTTDSQNNQSYNVPMINREMAYQKHFRKGGHVWKTYDYCGDQGVLLDILMVYMLDNEYDTNLYIILYATAGIIKLTQAMLNYEKPGIGNLAFITDVHTSGISTYTDDPMAVVVEHEFGILESVSDAYASRAFFNANIFSIISSFCDKHEDKCQCLPIAKTLFKVPNVYHFYYSEYSDILRFINKLKNLLREKDGDLTGIFQLRARTWYDTANLKSLWEEKLINILPRSYFLLEQYYSYRLSCNESPWIRKLVKTILCENKSEVIVPEVFTDHRGGENITNVRNYTCKPLCKPGETIHFDENRYLWECQACTNNSVKGTVGKKKCTQCIRGWEANLNKTFCFDTYQNLSLQFTDNSSIIMISVSGFMLSSILCTVLLFIKHNETPVVKSSNLLLTSIQLICQLLIVVVMPFMFIGDPNTLICALRPVSIGILLTISTAITMSKTRSLIRIFQSGIRLTNKDKMEIRVAEIFILIMFVVIDGIISISSFQFEKPAENYFISDEKKTRERYCNTDIHIIVHFGYIFILLVFNSVQAIRSRHLPANFKESRVIMLGNILSTIIVGNVIWLSFLQLNYYWKSIFMFYAIFLLNAITFIILYSYKVFIIVFSPNLNTKKYSNECIMKKIQKQAKQI